MKKELITIIFSLFLFGCIAPANIEVEPLPTCSFEAEKHNKYTYSCLTSKIPFIWQINNYNEQEINRVASAIKNAAEDLELDFEHEDVRVVLTNDSKFFNGRYWYFTPIEETPLEDSKEWDVFSNTTAYYQWQTSSIYVNITQENVEEPILVLPHEYIHVVSELNFDVLDKHHLKDILWVDLYNGFVKYWVEGYSL